MFQIIHLYERSYRVDMADTWWKRLKGLSTYTHSSPVEGMLFLFPWRARWSMSMRGMQRALDFLFFDHDQLVEIVGAVPPDYKKWIRPKQAVDRVVELIVPLQIPVDNWGRSANFGA